MIYSDQRYNLTRAEMESALRESGIDPDDWQTWGELSYDHVTRIFHDAQARKIARLMLVEIQKPQSKL